MEINLDIPTLQRSISGTGKNGTKNKPMYVSTAEAQN
jgi:hypothetical protein